MPSPALPLRKHCYVAKREERPSASLEQAFGQILQVLRKKQGLSQMDLAVATGYSLRYIGDIERGTKSATMRTMHDLATLLNVKLSVLVVEAERLWESDTKTRKRPQRPKR